MQRAQRKTRNPDLLVLLSVLWFRGKDAWLWSFSGKTNSDEGMSSTVADASGSEDMWVRVSTALDGSVFSLLLVFLDSLLSQRMTVMGGNMIFLPER